MEIVVIILSVAMGFAAVGMLTIATLEFLKSFQNRQKKEKTEIVPVAKKSADEPIVETPTPQASEKVEPQEKTERTKTDENAVTFGVSGQNRLTIEEEYNRAPRKNKKWFEKITEEMYGLERIRVKEGKYALTAVQGQDTVAKIQFVKGVICVDCTIVNPELKTYGKTSGTKIKQKPMRFKIVDETQMDAAIYAIKVSNQNSLDARTKKKTPKTENK